MLQNFTNCHISFSELSNLPELHRSIQKELGSSNFYLPSRVHTVTDRVAKQLEIIVPAEIKKLEDISSQVTAKKQTYKVYSMFQLHRTTKQQEKHVHWYITLTTSICFTISVGLLCFFEGTHFHKGKCYSFHTTSE